MAALGDRAVVSTADVTDAAAIGAEMATVAPVAVVHLAALSSVADSIADPAATWLVNTVGTVNVVEAVCRHAPGARLLAISSGEVYGESGAVPADEQRPLAPRSPYAASKAAAEFAVRQAVTAHGLDAVVARPFAHTGPGQEPRFALPSFAHQIARLERAGGGDLAVGDLTVERDLLDVRDVVAAYVSLLNPATPAGTYNVARGSALPLSALVAALIDAATAPVRIVPDPARLRRTDTRLLCGSADALQRATGWAPRIAIATTLADLLAAARALIGDTTPS